MATEKLKQTNRQLAARNEELRARLTEAEETLRALGAGEVDAFVMHGSTGPPRVFTLQGSEHAYRVMVETMSEGAVTISLDGTILYGNKALSRILGVKLSKLMGQQRLHELVLDAYLPRFAELLEQVQAGPVRERILLRTADSRGPRATLFSAVLLPWGEEGEAQVCMVLTDLSDIESAATELHAALERERVLAASEERFRLFAEVVPTIVWTTDPEGAATYFNQRFFEFSGLPAEEAYGWGWVKIIHPDDREQTMAAWRQAVSEVGLYQIEHRLRRADGAYRWYLCRALPLRDENGRVSRWYGTSTDITDAKLRQEDLENLTEQLERSNQELKEFAYIASHDLQEPLRSVTGFLNLLKRRYRGRLDAKADEFIDFAVNGAGRMHNLIQDLLSYSRVGSNEVNFQSVDVGKVLEQALTNLKVSIKESGARVTRMPLPVVPGDEMLLHQLFQNLISNALKFHGEQPPSIQIVVEQLKNDWLFSVQDKGIGLEPRQAERIFQIFQRLHTTAKYQGTGIGLAICKKIVERHHGRIWVESQPGEGATFYFTLPRKRPKGERPCAGQATSS